MICKTGNTNLWGNIKSQQLQNCKSIYKKTRRKYKIFFSKQKSKTELCHEGKLAENFDLLYFGAVQQEQAYKSAHVEKHPVFDIVCI